MSMRKLTEEYRELSQPVKAAMWFTICQFLQKGISVLTSPILARLLPKQEYGRASAYVAWEGILGIIIALSSSHAVHNLCVKYKDRKRILSSLIGYNMFLSIVWAVLLCFSLSSIIGITGLSRTLIICMMIHCSLSNQINCWAYIKQFDYYYKSVVLESVLCTFFTTFGILISIVFISRTAEAKIIPQVLVTAVIGLVIIGCARKDGKNLYDKEIWRFAFGFCVPLIPHYFSEIVLMSSDRIMIDRMCGSSDVAIYSVAYTVGSAVTIITAAINSSFAPYQYHKIISKEYKTLAKNTNIIIAFIAVCLCGIMLFGKEIILIFGGKKYLESISLVIPICLGVFFNYVFQLFGRVQEYFEQKHTIVIASISCAILNIILNYIFIGRYGYQAAAYTTFFCYLAFCFIHYIFYCMACKKYIGQEIYDIKGLVLISIMLIVASGVVSIVSKWGVIRYLIAIAAIVVVIWWRKKILEFAKVIKER